jgi:hypothetical protein
LRDSNQLHVLFTLQKLDSRRITQDLLRNILNSSRATSWR